MACTARASAKYSMSYYFSLILFAILQVVKNMRKRKDGMRMKNRANILVVLMETLETLSGNIAGSAILANAFHINLYL